MGRDESAYAWTHIERLYDMIMTCLAEERYHEAYVLMSDRTRRIYLLGSESQIQREILLQMEESTSKLEAAIQQAMQEVQNKLYHEINSTSARRAYTVANALGQYRKTGNE